ncbi:hypothetical protein [Arthrobacter sp. Bi83]|uniref:hypothetical protein n=1 Tax=Arthrobacter sp. Bi83 TaxID=2822353 RepID=UPI001E4EF43B|nr:hypothetical protein [Arthrobacter sp. Bi83]
MTFDSPYPVSRPPPMRRAGAAHGVPDAHPERGEQRRVEPREWQQDVPAGGADGEEPARHL